LKKETFKNKLNNLASKFINENLDSTKGKIPVENGQETTPKIDYLIESFLALAEIETIFEQLEQTPYFLSNFRQTKKLKEKGISRFNHIIYHIESYLFRITGIMDRMMILLNIIFETNLVPEKCKPYNFLLDKKGKEGKYAEIIKKGDPELFLELNLLGFLIQDFRKLRNEIAHQKRFNSKDLRDIELFNIVESDVEIDNFKYLVKRETDKTVSEYKRKMLGANEKIRIHLEKIYECLDFIWSEAYDKK
jgi:hypothetical protein